MKFWKQTKYEWWEWPKHVSKKQKFVSHILKSKLVHYMIYLHSYHLQYFAHLRQQCQNSKSVIFQDRLLKVSKCYNFLWAQRWHNCSPVASFANCVMTLYLLKVHLQTFLSIPVTQKCQILSCDTLVANEWFVIFIEHYAIYFPNSAWHTWKLCLYLTPTPMTPLILLF